MEISYENIRSIFRAWNWSWKGKIKSLLLILSVPSVQQLLKFTPTNLEYYFTFAIAIRTYPLEKLRYLDEAHFVPAHLLKGKCNYSVVKYHRSSCMGSEG